MTETGTIFLSAKCRNCKKTTLDGSMMSIHYGERSIGADRDVLVRLALTTTATYRPLTVGIEVSYAPGTDRRIDTWHSYRCDDPPCLIAVLRDQAHYAKWRKP